MGILDARHRGNLAADRRDLVLCSTRHQCRKFNKLMEEKSKAAFVKKLDDVEYLAWRLPMKYEDSSSSKEERVRDKVSRSEEGVPLYFHWNALRRPGPLPGAVEDPLLILGKRRVPHDRLALEGDDLIDDPGWSFSWQNRWTMTLRRHISRRPLRYWL